jgi:RNA polymerase sigma-70 factor (ECF subfamily)
VVERLPHPLPGGEPSDFALMAGVRAGAPLAFETLSDRWRPRLVNFLVGLGADRDGAEDCAQETLLRVYRYRAQYRPDHPFPSFLFTLARRSFLDQRRKAARWARSTEPVPVEDAEPADSEALPTDPATAVTAHLDLVAALATLPRRLRDVVELGAIRGLPYPTVAALLGLPVGTVKSRMHHAVARLREVLGGDGPA